MKKHRLPMLISAVLFAASVTAAVLWSIQSTGTDKIGEPPVFEDAV